VFWSTRRLVLSGASLMVAAGLVGGWWRTQRLDAAVASLVAHYSLPPRPPYPPQGPYLVNAMRLEVPVANSLWSGWVQAIPAGNWVMRLTATFTVPRGFQIPASGVPQLALWAGVFEDLYPLLQSGIFLNVDNPVAAGQWPAIPFLENYIGGSGPLQNEVLHAPPLVVQGGDRVRVTVTYPPVVGWPALAGFWMTSQITVRQGPHVVGQAAGRLYVPPWVHPNFFAVIVEVPGGGARVLPAGSWAVPTRWQVVLAHPWPRDQWARRHQVTMIDDSADTPTQVTAPVLRVHGATERGSGVVRYAGPG
jgi:hypothetical protein